MLVDIINSTIFINQLYTIFSFNISTTSKIKVDDPLYALFRNKIINDFDSLDISKLWYSKSTYNSYFNEITVIEKIHLIVKNLSVIIDNPLKEFLLRKFSKIQVDKLNSLEKTKYINVLEYFANNFVGDVRAPFFLPLYLLFIFAISTPCL